MKAPDSFIHCDTIGKFFDFIMNDDNLTFCASIVRRYFVEVHEFGCYDCTDPIIFIRSFLMDYACTNRFTPSDFPGFRKID